MTWSLFDADGRKTAQFTGREMDAVLNIPTGGEMVAGVIDGETQYWDGSTVLPRPQIDIPSAHALPINTDWTLTYIPDGTVVLIDGVEAGTTDGSDLVLTFPEARLWSLRLEPPFPFMPANCEVTAHAN